MNEEQKERKRERDAAYRATHKEELKAYAAAHKEEKKANNAAYAAAHKEERAIYDVAHHAAYYAAHRGEVLAYGSAYQKANPDIIRARSARYRARKLGAEGSYTEGDIKAQYVQQEGKCFWCGVVVRKDYHVDHVVPLARGGTNYPENIVIACVKCNQQKHDKLPHEWQQGGSLP